MRPPAQVQMLDLVFGHFRSRAVYVAVSLGVPDILIRGPKTADELAREAGAHPRSLYRLLRALASLGIFVEDSEARFSLTELGDTLRGDAANSVRAAILLGGAPIHWNSWTSLAHSVCTGESAFEHVHGMQFFEYLADHPEERTLFANWMTRVSQLYNSAIVGAYDFSAARTVVDVGGGHGSLLAAVLTANPHLRGILYDRPEVVREADEIDLAGLGDRCVVAGGDFFESAPQGGDLYLLKTILHDWNDEFARCILRNCRRAMPVGGRLLVIEMVIPPGNEPHVSKFMDLNMLVLNHYGQERTESEYRALFESAGFKLSRVISTRSAFSLLEGEPNGSRARRTIDPSGPGSRNS